MSYEGSPHPLILTDSSRNATETQDADFYDDLLKIWLVYYVLICTLCWELMLTVGSHSNRHCCYHWRWGSHTLCEWQSQGYDCTHSCSLSFGLVGTDEMVTFKINSGVSFAIWKISMKDCRVQYLRVAHVKVLLGSFGFLPLMETILLFPPPVTLSTSSCCWPVHLKASADHSLVE